MNPRKHRSTFAILLISLSTIGLLTSIFLYTKNNKPLIEQSKTTNNKKINYHYSYPSDQEFFETSYKFTKPQNDLPTNNIVSGIIPHHLLAADLIADFFNNLSGENFDTVVLLGPNHFSTGNSDIISSSYSWQTPYGVLSPDNDIFNTLSQSINIEIDETAIDKEHSITSEVAFIKKTFPQAEFLPIILKTNINQAVANNLAEALFNISKDKKILVLASVDFSHYKTNAEAQIDDAHSIQALETANLDKIYDLALDSPASIFTLLKYSLLRQTNFSLLANSNSALLSDQLDIQSTTSYITGYFLPGQPKINQKTNLLFSGDIMLARSVGDMMLQKQDWTWPFKTVADFTSQADILFGNLEGPISDKGHDMGNPYSFRTDPRAIAGLKLAGFNIVSVANNHIADWGREALADTLEILQTNAIAYAGGGFNNTEAHQVKIIKKNNIKFGFLAYTPFTNQYNEASDELAGISNFSQEKIAEDIKQAKKIADVIIVSFHFGDEYQTSANDFQTKLAHLAVDSGANLVIGHHPHVVQNIEKYQDAYIVYSLGNFIFDQTFSNETMNGLLFEATFTGNKITAVKSIPTKISLSLQVNL